MTHGISAIVVAHNQRDLLSICLASLKGWVNEIIVIDLESEQDLSETVHNFGGRLIKHKRVQIVEEIRQNVLKHANFEYILFVDPDESIPPTLARELKQLAQEAKIDYCEIPRQNYVFGEWVRESRWWPDYQVRFFRIGQVTWPRILHSRPEIKGTGYNLTPVPENAITHQNYLNLDEWFDKNRRYAKSDAQNRLDNKEDFNLIKAMRLSISEFVSRYFAGNGRQDGMRGLILAILQSFYYFLVYAYFWEGKSYAELEDNKSLQSFPRTWYSHGLSEIIFWDTDKTHFVKNIKSKLVRKMIS